MKYTVLPAGPVPALLTSQPKIRSLGEHHRAFLNANNPHGFLQEVSEPEANHPAPLHVRSTSYEIGSVLSKTVSHPNQADTLTTGLPYRLRVYFMQVEKAAQAKKEAKQRAKDRKKKLSEEEARAYAEYTRMKAALHPDRYREDPLQEVYDLVHRRDEFIKQFSPFEQFSLLRKHIYSTRVFYSMRAVVEAYHGAVKEIRDRRQQHDVLVVSNNEFKPANRESPEFLLASAVYQQHMDAHVAVADTYSSTFVSSINLEEFSEVLSPKPLQDAEYISRKKKLEGNI